MLRGPRLLTVVSLACLACGALVGARPLTARADVTGGGLGTPVVYGCSTSNPPSSGDTWYNTWADDDHIYATADDANGFAGSCSGSPPSFHGSQCFNGWGSNLVVNELDGPDPEHLTSPFTNCMTSYDPAGFQGDTTNCPDKNTWKTGGVLSVAGTLYLVVSRQSDGGNQYPFGFQFTEDATIVKSTDHGRHWTSPWMTNDPNGAAPPCNTATHHYDAMFPGGRFAAIHFINYGQDDAPWTAADGNGGDTYVYAMANDGFVYDGSNEILGRVLRTELASLDGTKWQFYQNNGFSGGSGSDPRNWTASSSSATPLITASHQLSQASVLYVPALKRYVMTSFYYPSFDVCWPRVTSSQNPSCSGADEARNTALTFYQAPAPWGPWTRFYTAANPLGDGWYDPTLVSKFQRVDGLSQTLFMSGDFIFASPDLYSLHAFPFAMSADSLSVADDRDSHVTYTGSWFALSGAGYFDDGTLRASNTPGDSASFTFSGTFVAWVGATNSDHGHAAVAIDGGQTTDVDTYSPQWSKQSVLYERTNLPSGTHRITITVESSKDTASSGTYQDVDAFEFGAAAPPVTGIDDAQACCYGGQWVTLSNSNYANGTLHADCNTAGGSANTMTFTFTAPYVRWIGATNSNHGLALVTIDGGPGFVVDTYSPQWGFQTVLLERTGLSDGPHTLTILPTGFKIGASSGFCQDVDALATDG